MIGATFGIGWLLSRKKNWAIFRAGWLLFWLLLGKEIWQHCCRRSGEDKKTVVASCSVAELQAVVV